LKAFLKKCKSGEDDPEFFITVIDQFLSDLPRHHEGIKQAVQRQDSEALVKTAHACKGSSRYMGALPLAEINFFAENTLTPGNHSWGPRFFVKISA